MLKLKCRTFRWEILRRVSGVEAQDNKETRRSDEGFKSEKESNQLTARTSLLPEGGDKSSALQL